MNPPAPDKVSVSSSDDVVVPTEGVAVPAAPVAPAVPAVVDEAAAIRRRARLRSLAVGIATTYLAGLLVVILAMRFIGEAWWVTTTMLYVPRIGFALPLPFVALGLLWFGGWRQILLLLPSTIAVLLFPLMGLHLGVGSTLRTAGAADIPARKLRVLTFNMAAAEFPPAAAAATIVAADADVILLQEWDSRVTDLLAPLLPTFHRSFNRQFGVLSRYRITDVYLPSLVPYLERNDKAARFARYRIATPHGILTVLNVHPISPRKGLEKFQRLDVRSLIKKGVLGGHDGVAVVRRNAAMRWEQAQSIAAEAARATGPVIIAGDTNLPGLSRIFSETLSSYRDGFAEVGRGFGYTFPAHQAWMRIDRILASPTLGFLRVEVLASAGGSDHLAVAADLIMH